MSKERLSKLQKWILINCYCMTVLHDNTRLIPLSGRNAPADKYIFFKDDILLSYFKLKSSRRYTFLRVHHFKKNKAYYSAQASLSRTLKNLHDKKYIFDCQSSNHIELTAAGRAKARELLNVKGCPMIEQPLTIRNNNDLSKEKGEVYIIY